MATREKLGMIRLQNLQSHLAPNNEISEILGNVLSHPQSGVLQGQGLPILGKYARSEMLVKLLETPKNGMKLTDGGSEKPLLKRIALKEGKKLKNRRKLF